MNIFRVYKIDLLFKTRSKTNYKNRKQKQKKGKSKNSPGSPLTWASPVLAQPTWLGASHP